MTGKTIATLNPPPSGLGLAAGVGELVLGQRGPSTAVPRKVPDGARIAFTVLNGKDTVSALADLNTGRPTITAGGARWNTIDRPQLVGLTAFAGYDPLQMTVPLLFDDLVAGNSVEPDIDMLWKMWGRGPRAANASKNKQPLPLVVDGELLPRMVRYSQSNPAPPNWVITNIAEDAASAVHNSANHVVRLAVTVTLEEYNTSSALASLTDDDSSGGRTKTVVYPVGTTMRKIARAQRTKITVLRTLNNYGSNHALDPYLRDQSKRFTKRLAVKVPRVKP